MFELGANAFAVSVCSALIACTPKTAERAPALREAGELVMAVPASSTEQPRARAGHESQLAPASPHLPKAAAATEVDEADLCPEPELTDAGALALRELIDSHARAPDPSLTKQLTAAQKAELKLLGKICETAVIDGPGGKPRVGCSCCPPFDECRPVRGGWPRGDLDDVYGIVTKTEGSFSMAGARELAITFDGCEPRSSNSGGTALYRAAGDRYVLVGYASGVRPSRCQRAPRAKAGRDALVCEFSDAHQGTGFSSVFVYDFTAASGRCWDELARFVDTSSLCDVAPGELVFWSRLDRVRLLDVNRDGFLDVRIEASSRSGPPAEPYLTRCRAQLNRETVPTRAELEATQAAIGPLQKNVLDFLSDGARFTPAP